MPSAPRDELSGAALAYGVTWDEIDRFAWDAICQWPVAAAFDAVHRGLDYAELTRWFLWDKVGRSIRRDVDPEGFEAEACALGWQREDRLEANPKRIEAISPRGKRGPMATLRRAVRALRAHPALNGPAAAPASLRPCVLVPVPASRTARAARTLAMRDAVDVVAPAKTSHAIDGARLVSCPPIADEPDWPFVERLYRAILAGLREAGAPMLTADARVLRDQLIRQARQILTATAMIERVRPDVMLVHADNHPTCQYYVLLGQERGIPSVMLQHGLDCEHYYLDEAYAPAIAVWGPDRKARYERDSRRKPAAIAVTGNPEYDDRRAPDALDSNGRYWLWVSRPHSPDKCYAPSRSLLEGVRIFAALLDLCQTRPNARLVVKPHPYDTVDHYRRMVEESGLGSRVEVTDRPPLALFSEASVVLTEDSTAGMESMFFGRPLVHVHFAPTPSTLPFVPYGAALPGFNREELATSLTAAERLDDSARCRMLDGQRRFLGDFAGPCDGHAAERVSEFVLGQVPGL